MTIVNQTDLFKFTVKVFKKMGCNKKHARTAAEVLLLSDLRGIDSHGVARLIGYLRLWEVGRINTNPKFKFKQKSLSTAVLDADESLGLVSAPFAMKKAIKMAKKAGSGWVAINNSNHFGIAGFHAMMALEKDMIGFAMTNATALVAPTNSAERLLGTNPIAIAIPAGKEDPYVADFATSTVARGKLEILQRQEKQAPQGWVQDAEGLVSSNPGILKSGGALLPLGGVKELGGHKGYCLGSWVDIFSAVLGGANYGPWVPPFVSYIPLAKDMPGKGLGHFVGAWRVDAFRSKKSFKKDMDQWIQRFKHSAQSSKEHKVQVPGEPEMAAFRQRSKEGIPIMPAVITDLKEVSSKLKIAFPFD